MAKPRASVDPAKRLQSDAQREVTRLLKIAEKLAVQAEKPEAGAAALVAIARLKSTNAGLDKRHASKVEAHIGGPRTTDEWLAKKAAEDTSDDDDD